MYEKEGAKKRSKIEVAKRANIFFACPFISGSPVSAKNICFCFSKSMAVQCTFY